MRELIEWLDRLDELVAAGHGEFEEHLKRVSAPFHLDFDQSVVRFIDPDQTVWSFGALPTQLAVMAWFDKAGSGGFTEDQSIAAQLGALLTIATNRRVEVAATDFSTTMEGTTQRNFLRSSSILDRALIGPFGGNPRDAFELVLKKVRGLDASDLDAIGSAISLHYAAVLLFDTDADAAYALAVAGIERLSREYASTTAEWSWWEDSGRLDSVFAELALTSLQAARLREELLKNKQLRLRQTFTAYVLGQLSSEFWSVGLENFVPGITMMPDGIASADQMIRQELLNVESVVPRDQDVLRRRLLASYDARSTYVHSGIGRRLPIIATTAQLVGQEAPRVAPIEFMGIRAILRNLIWKELNDRSTARELPQFLAVHPSPKVSDKE